MTAKGQAGALVLAAELLTAMVLLFAAPSPAAAQFFDNFPFFGGGGRGRQPSFIPFFDQPRARPRAQARPAAPAAPAPQADYSRAPAQTPAKAPDAKNVVVLGDSMADWLAYGLEAAFADTPEVSVVRKTRPYSSLIYNAGRHDPRTSVDWPVGAREMLANEPASFIVMMIGVGDRDAIRVLPPRPAPKPAAKPGQPDAAAPGEQSKPANAPDSTDATAADQGAPDPHAVPVNYEFKTEKWAELYGKRIDEMIAALKSKGVPVFWVGLPPVFGPRATADMQYLNDLFRSHAEKAGITYIEVWDGFADEQGRFVLQGPDYEGQIRRLRTPDGIYFTPAGARKLAHYVEREIQRALTPTGPIAVRIPEESLLQQAPAAAQAPAPSGGTPRPLAGPVVPLNASVEPSKTAALLGGTAPQQSIADAVANRVLVKGDPMPAPAGRADDFAWPRRAPAPVGTDPVAATTDLPLTPMVASNGAAQPQDATPGAQAARTGAPGVTPGAGPARARVVQAPAARARPRVSYQQPFRNPFFFFFGR